MTYLYRVNGYWMLIIGVRSPLPQRMSVMLPLLSFLRSPLTTDRWKLTGTGDTFPNPLENRLYQLEGTFPFNCPYLSSSLILVGLGYLLDCWLLTGTGDANGCLPYSPPLHPTAGDHRILE